MRYNLDDVSGIGKITTKRMRSAGIDSIEKLVSVKIEDLLKIKGIGKSSAIIYIENAKKLLEKTNEVEKKEISEKKESSERKLIINSKVIKEQKYIKKFPERKKKKEKKIFSEKKFTFKSKKLKKQISIKKRPREIKTIEKRDKKILIETFFPEGVMQRIRFLHFKIKHLEETLQKKNEDFPLDDLNLVLDYVKILNINYKTQSQIKIFKELNITPNFYDPIENRDIQIWDLMFECARVLWVLARVYAELSKKFEAENRLKNAIVAMVACSKIYKTAAYFSAACTRQEDIGKSLSAENLELNSEEARIFAQNLSALREENKNNLFIASQMYAGLSALSKRFYFLKEHDKIKKQHLKAQFNYDMGKACYLRAKALLRSSIVLENEEKIKKLKQKSNYYFSKAEEKWETLLKKSDNLSKAEIDNLKVNVSIVNENIIENDVEILNYNDTKNIQNPEPFIAVPENLGLFLPRSTMYLTKYRPRDLNFDRFKEYKISKLDLDSRHSKIEKLFNKKAGIGRTIKQLKFLYDKNDIDINIFFELLEKYEIKLEMVESTLEKLKEADKPRQVDKKRAEQGKVTVFHS